MTRWLADECVAAPLVALLRDAGHDVLYITEHRPGAADIEVIELAVLERRIVLTEDKDFGEMALRNHLPVPGLVLMRLSTHAPETAAERLAVLDARMETLEGRFVLVEDARLRSRLLPRPASP